MENNPKHSILCIDDDESILKSLKRILRCEDYNILLSSSTAFGLTIMEKNDIHVVLCEQRMPEMSGIDFFAKVRSRYPDAVRIVLTGFADVDAISESINQGHIYKIFFKPWSDENLKFEVQKAIEYFDLMQNNRKLNRQVLEQNAELKLMNENLERIVAQRVQDLNIQDKVVHFSRVAFADLPLAVIGISLEGTIALMSRATAELPGIKNINIGDNLSDCLSPELSDTFFLQLSINEPCVFNNVVVGGRLYNIHVAPLTGEFQGRGGIIIFVKKDDK